MNRFKFRGWSEQVRKMTYFGTGTGIITMSKLKEGETYGIFFPSTDGGVYLTGYQDFMQCTGLQDKNGNDIYEGDIIKTSLEATAVVEWEKEGRFLAFTIDRKIIYINREPAVEVIGNIHENPERLERKGERGGGV